MLDRYGAPIYRVAVDLGFGCPNRDENGAGGCTFCPPDGSRAVFNKSDNIADQVRDGITFVRQRYGSVKFMAYVQTFTGTFAPVAQQRACYEEILSAHPFDALTIATRPDCIDRPTLDLFAELRKRMDLWIELGVQTSHDTTLQRINRGHTWEDSVQAIQQLDDMGITVAPHIIIGLPGENPEHFYKTASQLSRLPIQAIKIHNLHIIRGTQMATDYATNPFPVYDEHDYAEVLIDVLRRLRPDIGILRLNTDTPKQDLIAPRWHMVKTQFLSYLEKQMRATGVCQGDLCGET
jgi:radical SAM protein (TIGR01212 family)